MSKEQQKSVCTPFINESSVVDYLQKHPDFFLKQIDLLSELKIPHMTGDAISLIERQVAQLREKNADLTKKLLNAIDIARENEHLFELTKRLSLQLFEIDQLQHLIEVVDESMRIDFNADAVRFLLFSEHFAEDVDVLASVISIRSAKAILGPILRSTRPVCGHLDQDQVDFLFTDISRRIASCAVVPLGMNGELGILTIGSEDPEHFAENKDTLFLNFIGEILERLLPRHKNATNLAS